MLHTAPTQPTASAHPGFPTSGVLAQRTVGELSTALVLWLASDREPAHFRVNAGRVGPGRATSATWTSDRFVHTVEGERAARARFDALVSAAVTVQS